MTIEEAEKFYQSIVDASGDDELARSLEDKFRELVLNEVAKGNQNSDRLADIALSTRNIEFSRWYA